jgi:hypothetical protein
MRDWKRKVQSVGLPHFVAKGHTRYFGLVPMPHVEK